MNRCSFAFVLAGAAMLLTGCPDFVKAPGSPFTASATPPGKATVYFYRPARKIMSDYPIAMSIPHSADNCFRMESGGYTTYVSDPGKVEIAAAMTGYITFNIDLRPDDTRYVRVEFDGDDKPIMTEVPAAQARTEIAETRGIETCGDKVHAK